MCEPKLANGSDPFDREESQSQARQLWQGGASGGS